MTIGTNYECSLLKQHFNAFYQMLAESKLTPQAKFEKTLSAYRAVSGLVNCYENAVMGILSPSTRWDDAITEQLDYFKQAKLPFIWILDENEAPEFKKKLLERGFKDGGIFKGILKYLEPTPYEVSKECELELVQDEKGMDDFNELAIKTFGILEKIEHKKFLVEGAKNGRMFHWLGRKEGKVVAIVTSLIENNIVSIWYGATNPEIRHKGYCTDLSKMALNHAASKGCKIATTYLMSDGMALGVCEKLGGETKWRFNAFISPS